MTLLPGLPGLTDRSFSFYPPILGIAHNEWRFRRANWSDFVVVNTHSGEEACIPRSFVSDVSANAPTVIVGLTRDLQWRDGMIAPYRRPVVELPVAVNDGSAALRHTRPAPVVSIRLEPRAPSHSARKAVVIVMLGIVGSAIVDGIVRPSGLVRDGIDALRVSRTWRQLRPGDDYASVVGKLGAPAAQRTYVEAGGRVFRSLDYPRRHFTILLEGQTEAEARYAGALDARGRILGSAPVFGGSDALRSVPRF
jgi:hypothetical protein